MNVVPLLAESDSQMVHGDLTPAFEARPRGGIDCETDFHEKTGKLWLEKRLPYLNGFEKICKGRKKFLGSEVPYNIILF